MYSNTSCGSNPALEASDLGKFREGTSILTLKGGQVNNYKCSGEDITSARLNYRIYPSAGVGGSFTVIDLLFSSDFDNGCGGKDQQWQNLGADVNVLNGLTPGNYTIEFYCDQSTTAGTQYLSNSSNNYKATFTVYADFITSWNLAIAGSGADQLSFGVATSGTVSYTWQEVSPGSASGSGTFSGSTLTITGLPASSVIRLNINPINFQRIIINNGANRNRLIDIEQWGSVTWTSMANSFFGCENLNISSIDLPVLNGVSDMSLMFAYCNSLNGPANIGNWNTSSITNMAALFAHSPLFNKSIGNWNVSLVNNMTDMFAYASAFNQSLSNWNVSSVTNMNFMFFSAAAFNQNIGSWTLNSNVSLVEMLSYCGMDCLAYSTTLIDWRNNALTPSGRMLTATGRLYSTAAVAARSFLTSSKGWTITGDAASGRNCDLNAFITIWKTDNSGTSNSTSITIPTIGSGYNYDVDWNNDGVYDELGIIGNATHDFGVAGTYTVRIRGAFPRIYFNNGGDKLKFLNISQWGNIFWTSMANAFYGCTNLNITSTDVPDLTNVTSMSYMFRSCSSLNGPANIGTWNISSVTNFLQTFAFATAFNQPIGNWNTSAVTDMNSTFWSASSFNQPLTNWNTSACTYMYGMFYGTPFNQPIGNWDVDAVTSFNQTFASSAFNQNLGGWTLNSSVNLNSMFNSSGMDCLNYSGTLIGWSNNPTTPNGRSLGATGRLYSTVAEAARTNLTIMKGWSITGDAASGSNCDPNAFITTWKTNNAGTSGSTSITIPTTASGFSYDVDWNNDGVYDEFGISGNVTHDFGVAGTYTIRIKGSFPRIYFNNGGDKRKLLNISQWGDIAWTSMGSAFYGCENLNITATDVPDLSSVTDMSYMFADCYVLNSPANIGSWNTSTVAKMNYLFSYASAFNQPIGNWNTAAVNTMYSMFYYALAFNQPIGNWNTSAVTTMSVMFAGAWSFNQPIGNWNTSAVSNMSSLFWEAYSFNQYLGNWTLKSGVVMNNMLNNCGMNCSNYSATLIGWSKNPAIPINRILGATGRQYNYTGLSARDYLVNNKGWIISDAGLGVSTVLAAMSGGGQVCNINDVSTNTLFTDGNCNSIAFVTPNGANPVSGNVNTCVKIESVLPVYNGRPYLQRHFDITPASDPFTSTAKITLFVLQSEFDNYNASNGLYPDLPTNPSDATGIANILITQYSGTGTAPGNYSPGTMNLIDPADADIVWNGYHWEISFNVSGFSGFYIHSFNLPLPVNLISFSGYKLGAVNKLNWTTSAEQNNRGFEMQYSTDGINFTTIGFVHTLSAEGNSSDKINYSFTDYAPVGNQQYYRLRMMDNNGTVKMSNVIVIKSVKPIKMVLEGVYPNPANTHIHVAVSRPHYGTVTLSVVDFTGRVLTKQVKSVAEGVNTITLNVSSLSSGSYILKAETIDFETVTQKFIKN